MHHKQLEKGLRQLTEEGVAQLFIKNSGRRRIIGAVGALQFEIIQYRLVHEYSAACRMVALPYTRARWITCKDPEALKKFTHYYGSHIVSDKDGRPVYLAESDWDLRYAKEIHPAMEFHFTSELDGDGSGKDAEEMRKALSS
jgi:peptide chain release factor 3